MSKYKYIILISLFALSSFVILLHFTDTPRVWLDEGIYTNVAESVAFHGVFGLQTAPGQFFRFGAALTTNYPVIFPVALMFKLFCKGLWQARLPMIIYMFLLAILFYLFAKKKYGFLPAVLSVLSLISFAPFYGNGRPVQGEIPGLVFLVLGALLLVYLEESKFQSKKLALLAGLSFGLSAATKSLFLLLLLAALFVTTILWFQKIKNKKIILFAILGFLAPLVVWFVINFPTADLRAQIIPTMLHQAGNNGGSSMSDTTQSLSQTILINFKRFFTESTPVLFTFLAICIAFAFIKKRNLSISELLLFSIIILNWLGYLLGTGWYRYFFPAHVLLYLFFPAAIISLNKKFLLAIPIVLILFQFYYVTFHSVTPFVNPSATNGELYQALSVIPANKKVLFDGTVDATVFFKGHDYFQHLIIPGIFEAGDKNALGSTVYDFIVADDTPENIAIVSSKYTHIEVGHYLLFQKR